MNNVPVVSNVIIGPWKNPPVRKPWKRMTRIEKCAFTLWEKWFIRDVLCALSRLGVKEPA